MLQNSPLENEKALLRQIAGGDQRSFDIVFVYYSRIIYPVALKLTRSSDLAEEILQDVFLKIWINRHHLITIENFGAYLNRIIRNHSYNILRRLAHEALLSAELSKELSEQVNNTEEEINYTDIQQSLNRIINKLTPQQKLVYTLCDQEGLKYNEIADRLNISSQTVHTHIKQARKFIRQHLIQISSLILFCLFFK